MKNKFFLALLSLIIAFFSVSYILMPQRTFSEHENRVLQTTPDLTLKKLLDGTFSRQLHNCLSDQINLRTKMIEIKSFIELAKGKKENGGILLGRDDYLIEAPSYNDANYQNIERNLAKIERLMKKLIENDVKVTSAIVPRKIDVCQDKIPSLFSAERVQAIWQCVSDKHLNLSSFLASIENAFYKTDHHWTSDGAYAAYQALSKEIGYAPVPISSFDLQTLSTQFQGTSYSKSGFFFIKSEEIKAPTIENGKYKVTIIDTNAELDSLYDTSYLSKKDKYGVFLSGNNAHVKIYDTKNPEKETLLLIKDSFSHSLAPYLCEHFNLELIDPRYFAGSIEDYIFDNNIKNVLFLFGIDTLASANLIIR